MPEATHDLTKRRCSEIVCFISQSKGQLSLEYGLVVFAFLTVLLALAGLWKMSSGGIVTEFNSQHSSHSISQGPVDFAKDLAAF